MRKFSICPAETEQAVVEKSITSEEKSTWIVIGLWLAGFGDIVEMVAVKESGSEASPDVLKPVRPQAISKKTKQKINFLLAHIF